MRIKLTAFVIALLAIPLASSGQGVKDVSGWNGARWGMDRAQVQAAMIRFGLPVQYDSKQQVLVSTKNLVVYMYPLVVYMYPMEVTFVFDHEKLSRLMLNLSDDYMNGYATPDDRSRCFDELKQGLTEKYGKPTDENTKNEDGLTTVREHSVWWSFPSTRITLDDWELSASGVKPEHNLYVEYEAPLKNPL